ncbi:MAG: YdcF family protein [Planctomycetales bacterium]|nr:YdcF family protein [Planctomycetales bacterium]
MRQLSDNNQRSAFGPLQSLAMMAGLASTFLVIGITLEGKTGFEKVATTICMPIGVCWFLFGGYLLAQARANGLRSVRLGLLLWIAFYALSTAPLKGTILFWLEHQQIVFDTQQDEPLDVLVVLGGGTSQGPDRAQTGPAGDRVVYAAELYKLGKTKLLATTGQAYESLLGTRRSPSEQTEEIWKKLGIPDGAIQQIEGINTYQELQSIQKQMAAAWQGKRIGLLTSAWHLPRAMRLAQAANLQGLIPVAADYRSVGSKMVARDFVPNVDALFDLALCQHELMAFFLGR